MAYIKPTKDRFTVTTAGWRKSVTKMTVMKSYLAKAQIRDTWGTRSVVLTLYRDVDQTTNQMSFTPEIIEQLYAELKGLR
jgi:hypothetical protein